MSISATTGAAPVPVPPPIPAVIKTIWAPFRAVAISILALLGSALADLGIGACAAALGELLAQLDLRGGLRIIQSLLVGVHCNKLNTL